MKRISIGLVFVILIFTGCDGQNNKNSINVDSLNIKTAKPKIEVNVNKEYDDDGNLISYDSTYSYYYSNVESDSILRDSIFNNFKMMFNNEFQFTNDPFFDDLFFQDSLTKYDFYNNDFFTQRFMNNNMMMKELFRQMDSIKNQFFDNEFSQSKH